MTGANPKVRGMSRATPMTAVRPGRAPKTIPRATPMKLAMIASGLHAEPKAEMKASNMGVPPFREEEL